jgi:Pyridoxal phosphate biosynthesis protein
MLIYNEKLSVSPITTHIPIKYVNKNINKKKIINNINKINDFFKINFKKNPKIAVLGLNPHCETTDKISEEKIKLIPAINYFKKKKIYVKGPFSADTFFSTKNIKHYDVVIGMYHDQVLTPIKTLFNFNAINLTIGLPFIRVSPDHGPNYEMLGKNKSDASSIFYAIKFFNMIS